MITDKQKILKVVVADQSFANLDQEQECARKFDAEFAAYQCSSEQEVIDALAGADLAFVNLIKVTARAVAGMNKGATIIRYGVGYDNIPLEACKEHGVRVCNVPDYGTAEVADHAVAMLLATHRRLTGLDRQVRDGNWNAASVCGQVSSLSEVTLGLLGCGRIAREVIKRMKPFGVSCIGHDPAIPSSDIEQAGASSVELDELWRRSDLISLHAPVTNSTKQIVNEESIARMKKGVVIVNCARGELINEEDLASALEQGQVAAAGLDVFASEPLAKNSVLQSAPNVLLSPHAAWCSAHAAPRLQTLAAEEGMRALAGEKLRCQVI